MNTTQPIRNIDDLENIKNYYLQKEPNQRNYLFIILSLNTALRVSDILDLCWDNVYDFSQKQFREHLSVTEHKTEKKSVIYINQNVSDALEGYMKYLNHLNSEIKPQDYLFASTKNKNQPISRVQAFRIVKKAAEECHIEGVISCHSLRKTFGYHAWKQGIQPALLMNIYNHSSFQVTCRYLGIEQDDRDQIFQKINL